MPWTITPDRVQPFLPAADRPDLLARLLASPAGAATGVPAALTAPAGQRPKWKDVKDSKDFKDFKDTKDIKDFKDIKDTKDFKDTKDTKDGKDGKETKDTKDGKDFKDGKEGKDGKDFKDFDGAAPGLPAGRRRADTGLPADDVPVAAVDDDLGAILRASRIHRLLRAAGAVI